MITYRDAEGRMEWAAEQNVFELPLGATPYIPIPISVLYRDIVPR